MYCTNCGKHSHLFKHCKEPVISFGLICFYKTPQIPVNKKLGKYAGEKVILVQRRHTIGFIEFIRGKYDIDNNDYIIRLLNMMTHDEKQILKDYNNFDIIRKHIGLTRDTNYKLEYDEAKNKFNTLINNSNGNMLNILLNKSYTRWTSPEWGIPKGRRNYKEYDIDCAIREFVEETGINHKHINVYRNVKPLEETYKGINGITYKHIYYLASIKNNNDANLHITQLETNLTTTETNITTTEPNLTIETNLTTMEIDTPCNKNSNDDNDVKDVKDVNYEVSSVKLFNLNECHKLIRPYYISKLNAIKKGFQLITSIAHYFE